jgi:hypothetical protein
MCIVDGTVICSGASPLHPGGVPTVLEKYSQNAAEPEAAHQKSPWGRSVHGGCTVEIDAPQGLPLRQQHRCGSFPGEEQGNEGKEGGGKDRRNMVSQMWNALSHY